MFLTWLDHMVNNTTMPCGYNARSCTILYSLRYNCVGERTTNTDCINHVIHLIVISKPVMTVQYYNSNINSCIIIVT